MPASDPWPTEIRLSKDKVRLTVTFDDGGAFDLPAEFLRVHSPSAEVQGHSAAQRKTVGGKRRVGIIAVDPIGNYAVKLTFDDGHATGIFTWTYLRKLGVEQEAMWAAYLAELEAKGMRRD